MPKVLLVEDDLALQDIVIECLSSAGYEVSAVVSGMEGLSILSNEHHDLVILDWALPGLTGLEICSRFREEGGATPILFLTGKSTVSEKEAAFDVGADDYLTKPFNVKELLMRVRALLKRPPEFVGSKLRVGALELNLDAFCATASGAYIALTRQEFAVLEVLMRNPNLVFSCEELLERAWTVDSDVSTLTVKACVKRLRGKLPPPCSITNLRGEGYKLVTE